MIKSQDFDANISINKICKTHNIKCSKTGWELGWYLGTNSKALWTIIKICQNCGQDYRSKRPTARYCKNCGIKIRKERIIFNNKKVKEKIFQTLLII